MLPLNLRHPGTTVFTPPAATFLAFALGLAFLAHAPCALADTRVAVRAIADAEYSAHKFGPDGPTLETYVFMEGRFFEGATADRSISRMPFRSIAEMLSHDLARHNYRPAKDLKSSDLLIVVHWGTTIAHVTTGEMSARTHVGISPEQAAIAQQRELQEHFSPETVGEDENPIRTALDEFELSDDLKGDLEFERMTEFGNQFASDLHATSNAELLGYRADLRRFNNSPFTLEEERTLRHDLLTERYFIIMKAYALKNLTKKGKPVWTVYLNIRSPGINFSTAVDRLGYAGSSYFGLQTDRVTTVRAKDTKTTVTIEPAIILGVEE